MIMMMMMIVVKKSGEEEGRWADVVWDLVDRAMDRSEAGNCSSTGFVTNHEKRSRSELLRSHLAAQTSRKDEEHADDGDGMRKNAGCHGERRP
jgi:hypothetical protein